MKSRILHIMTVAMVYLLVDAEYTAFVSPPKLAPNFQDDVVKNEKAPSAIDCGRKCSRTKDCSSFNYLESDRTCTLYNIQSVDAKGVNYGRICTSYNQYVYELSLNLCYKIQTIPMMGIMDAKQACRSEGGRLIRITSDKMNIFMNSLISTDNSKYQVTVCEGTTKEPTSWACTQLFLGYSASPGYFIDAFRPDYSSYWSYFDGTGMPWNKWAPGQPNASHAFNCAWLRKDDMFLLADFDCFEEDLLGGYICEIPTEN